MKKMKKGDLTSKVIGQIQEGTKLGMTLKSMIPDETNRDVIIFALAYVANDIAKEGDFKKRKSQILGTIDAIFEMWGDT